MDKKDIKKKVLFICTHNSARSQMAEGLVNAFLAERYEAFSAGIEPSGVNPFAVEAMAEIGVDISYQRSKSLDEFLERRFDYVVTVCDHADEMCPFFPGGEERIHKGFEDPASIEGSPGEKLSGFIRIRDEIRKWIEEVL